MMLGQRERLDESSVMSLAQAMAICFKSSRKDNRNVLRKCFPLIYLIAFSDPLEMH